MAQKGMIKFGIGSVAIACFMSCCSNMSAIIKSMAVISNPLRNARSLTSPNFLFLAERYAKAPRIMSRPAKKRLLGRDAPDASVRTPSTSAAVEPR